MRGSRESEADPPSIPRRRVPPFLGSAACALENRLVAAGIAMPVAKASCMKSRRDMFPLRASFLPPSTYVQIRSLIFSRFVCLTFVFSSVLKPISGFRLLWPVKLSAQKVRRFGQNPCDFRLLMSCIVSLARSGPCGFEKAIRAFAVKTAFRPQALQSSISLYNPHDSSRWAMTAKVSK